MRLQGAAAIVTGAGRGIGRAIALALSREGASIVVDDIVPERAESVAGEIKAAGGRALSVKADVTSAKEVDDMVKTAMRELGKIDILVNNAGGSSPEKSAHVTAEELPEELWDWTIGVNLKGQFLCSRAVGRQMIRQRHGKIVNIASVGAHRAIDGMAAYCAAKAGVVQLTAVLAVEWAKYNINVNAVSPGMVLTEKVAKSFEAAPDLLRGRLKGTPLGRGGKPEDIASAVLFLASSESDYMTGQAMIVDGGTAALHPGYLPAQSEQP